MNYWYLLQNQAIFWNKFTLRTVSYFLQNQAIFRKQTSMRMVLYLLQQTNLFSEGTLQDPQILFENSVVLQTQQMQTMYFLLSTMVQMYIS